MCVCFVWRDKVLEEEEEQTLGTGGARVAVVGAVVPHARWRARVCVDQYSDISNVWMLRACRNICDALPT